MSLWNCLLRRWLDPPPLDAEEMCRHLRRDIGIDDAPAPRPAAYPIRDRNCFPSQTFYALQSYR